MSPAHLFSAGDTVVIVRIAASTGPLIEGKAVVRIPRRRPHRYQVQFIGEHCVCERSVHAVFQHDSEELLAAMRELWRADRTDAPAFTDFFPDQHPQSKV